MDKRHTLRMGATEGDAHIDLVSVRDFLRPVCPVSIDDF
jgi:hypothetical protein